MKRALLGAVVSAGLVMAVAVVWDQPSSVFAQRATTPMATTSDAGLIALPNAAEHGQLVTVIDPKSRVMSVYHVDSVTGRIKLMSVRNISWDLQMMQLNSENPLPQEIRSLLEQR
jgi:hypothetical protein